MLGSLAPSHGPTQQHVGSTVGMPHDKQLTAWGQSPTHQQTGCLKTSEPSRHGPAHQRAKNQLQPPVGRHQPLSQGSLHKPLDQSHPPGGRHQKQENYGPAACRPDLQMQARYYPGTSWPLALGDERRVHCWDA